MKFKALTFALASLAVICAMAQQPQTNDVTGTQPLFSINSKYLNGVAPGYWPTAGAGLTLNVSAGTVWCQGTIRTYAGGTLTMTNSATNYVYLDPTASCAPATGTSIFTSAQVPVAVVVAAGGVITTITDDRALLQAVAPGSGTVTSVTFTGDGTVDSSTPSSAVTTSGTVTATLKTQAANTIFGNFTGSTAGPLFNTINSGSSCGDSTHALSYTNGTGFGCQSITGGGGGGVAWNAITNAVGNLSLTMGANTSLWTYNATTGSNVDLWTITDTASNTGTGFQVVAKRQTGSAMGGIKIIQNSADSTPGLRVLDSTSNNNHIDISEKPIGGNAAAVVDLGVDQDTYFIYNGQTSNPAYHLKQSGSFAWADQFTARDDGTNGFVADHIFDTCCGGVSGAYPMVEIRNNGSAYYDFSSANFKFSHDKGQHFVMQAATSDASGTIALSSATSASVTFTTAYIVAPSCVLTPTSDPTTTGTWWVTVSTTAVTAHVGISGSITFNYLCVGNPN